MTSEEIKAQSEWAIKYNRCCDAVGGGDFVTCTEKIYATIEELRKTKHALWMARAYNGYNTTYNQTSYHNYMIEHPNTKITSRRWYHCWKMVERKCLQKAMEFK